MKLGYELTIEQSQKLVMTPELIQAIQILQFNTQELESFVDEQLLINPILEAESHGEANQNESNDSSDSNERNLDEYQKEEPSAKKDEEFDWSEYFKEREFDDISYKQNEYHKQDPLEFTFEHFATNEITLTEHLMFQLQFAPIKKSCRQIGRYIIESLDDNGYMTLKEEEIATNLNVSLDKINIVMEAIHNFDPLGVGAKDLKECLIIQLKAMGEDTEFVREIVYNHLEDIAANRLGNIAKSLGICVKEVQELSDVIKGLEPKPGRQFSSANETRYIVPDVTVEKVDGEYVVTINESSVPKLNVSTVYKKMLMESEKDSNISKFLSDKLNSALWLIKSIEQRRQTIYNVVKAVVKYQIDFFEEGPKHLKTLTLKQIADEVGIHESTVSRSINGKYMQSPRGVFELKYFFTSGVSNASGQGVASESIKTFIKEIVDSENPSSPYSDQAIVEMLKEKGFDISRRTVAKYRDEMKLPSSSKRKRY